MASRDHSYIIGNYIGWLAIVITFFECIIIDDSDRLYFVKGAHVSWCTYLVLDDTWVGIHSSYRLFSVIFHHATMQIGPFPPTMPWINMMPRPRIYMQEEMLTIRCNSGAMPIYPNPYPCCQWKYAQLMIMGVTKSRRVFLCCLHYFVMGRQCH